MGNYLITGYPLYEWREKRTPGTEWTSTIFKHSGQGRGTVGSGLRQHGNGQGWLR